MRCWWCGDDPEYRRYHDQEWGVPVADDTRLFEKLCLEGFQAGLSWLTILRKRENFRRVFAGFDIEKVAAFEEPDIERLLQDKSIIRHRGKIEAAIHNARRTLEIQKEFGSLAAFIWRYEPSPPPQPSPRRGEGVEQSETGGGERPPAFTPQSKNLSRDLKQRGFKFVGPTTCYAFMQSMGLVNDHMLGCDFYDSIERARKEFKRPC